MIEFDAAVALRAFELAGRATFAPGATVIAGPSGAGKTTLLRAIAGLTRIARGSITIGGIVADDGRRAQRAEQRRLGYVPQDYGLFPHLDVGANIAFGLVARRVPAAERRRRLAAAVAALGLHEVTRALPGALSGGERQRVALARALVIEPRALLLDEPFAALDRATREGVRAGVADVIARTGIPVLVVTHDEADAAALSAPVVRIERGRISSD